MDISDSEKLDELAPKLLNAPVSELLVVAATGMLKVPALDIIDVVICRVFDELAAWLFEDAAPEGFIVMELRLPSVPKSGLDVPFIISLLAVLDIPRTGPIDVAAAALDIASLLVVLVLFNGGGVVTRSKL